VLLLPLALAWMVSDIGRRPEQVVPPPQPVVVAPAPKVVVDEVVRNGRFVEGQALSAQLSALGVSPDEVAALLRSVKNVVDARALARGISYQLTFVHDQLQRATLSATNREGVPRRIDASRAPADGEGGVAFAVVVADAPVQTELRGVSADVKSSVYTAIVGAGESPSLVERFVSMFGWSIDFYRQAQKGDRIRMVVEKRFAGLGEERRFLGDGAVLAAEYLHDNQSTRAFQFRSADGLVSGLFAADGTSLERTFVRAPMEITHVTSHFGSRFHPVYKHQKKHEGIDYGAPIGTPVWSVADGVVAESRFSSTAGNMVVVDHGNGLSTEYFHLSRAAVARGVRIKQKQVLGFVGNTGVSTGAHLHFGMLRHGHHVDPSKEQGLPAANPLPLSYREEFEAWLAPLAAQLDSLGST
jgi:murein DD-endopeptidase MepM/ murein hydrolase activator NlpD